MRIRIRLVTLIRMQIRIRIQVAKIMRIRIQDTVLNSDNSTSLYTWKKKIPVRKENLFLSLFLTFEEEKYFKMLWLGIFFVP
jgi:hypothetical protein